MTPVSADDYLPAWEKHRRPVTTAIIGIVLLTPAVQLIAHHGPTAQIALLVPGTVIFTVLASWIAVFRAPGTWAPDAGQTVPRAWLCVIVALGIALFAAGQLNWLAELAVAAAACGRFSATPRPAILGASACAVAGLGVALWKDFSYGGTLAVMAVPAMTAFLAYSASRRNEMVEMLRRTRAELATVAVAEERLRIARDLHDLLGHSLSLITLKAELAGRLIEPDAGRAAREVAEIESVARRSLSEVRGALTGYRQPDLAAELAAARQLLAAAGITCQITAPRSPGLAPRVDTLLAWTVREAVTNVVRHSGADRATITVRSGPSGASVEVTDNGGGGPARPARPGPLPPDPPRPDSPQPGRRWPDQPRPESPQAAGAGLAGLAERVGELGGEMVAGPARPGGFRLLVTIPAGRLAS
jgi:two-component system sensor histidine kinase DesK